MGSSTISWQQGWQDISLFSSLPLPRLQHYDRDLFLFVFLVLTIVAFSTSLQPVRTPLLLNRQQTEEWKGWMQVCLLKQTLCLGSTTNGKQLVVSAWHASQGFIRAAVFPIQRCDTMGFGYAFASSFFCNGVVHPIVPLLPHPPQPPRCCFCCTTTLRRERRTMPSAFSSRVTCG